MVLLRLSILVLSTQALAFRGPAYRNGAASRRRPLRDAIAPLSSTERIDRCYAPDLVDEETSSRLAPEVGPLAWNTTARRVDIVAAPARAVIRERIHVGEPAPMVSHAEITEALGY